MTRLDLDPACRELLESRRAELELRFPAQAVELASLADGRFELNRFDWRH
jgi:hypothetical protein